MMVSRIFLLTGLGPKHLFLNRGNGTFTDASSLLPSDSTWSTSAAFLDYDRDGDLDLFVCSYVRWFPEGDLYCTLDGKSKSYCTPESYTGEQSRLYRNDAGRGFTDVSEAAGILKGKGKSLGVAVLDYDEDGWPDIAVANDTQPNLLFHNRGNGSFEEVGVETGMAFSESGVARGAMGIDSGDYLNRGPESLLIGNFSNQMLALYHNAGSVFIDKAPSSSLGKESLLFLAFGLFFFDFDLDGHLDILVANGHVENDIQKVQEQVSYEERPLLFRNLGDGNFEEVGLKSGPGLSRAVVGQGRRLRRRGWRRRPRRGHHRQSWTAPAAHQPRGQRSPKNPSGGGGGALEPERDRDEVRGQGRGNGPETLGEERVLLLFPERAARELRLGRAPPSPTRWM